MDVRHDEVGRMGFRIRGLRPVGLGGQGGHFVPGPAQGTGGAALDVGFQGGGGDGVLWMERERKARSERVG